MIREKLTFYMQATAIMKHKDELYWTFHIVDAKIHLVLLRYVVVLYNNIRINKNSAQLIFTSHDLSIMNYNVFHCDEIWFVAKGKGDLI